MPNTKTRKPDDADQQASLQSAGLKVTLPRLKVLDVFRSSKTRHLSADDVFRNLMQHDNDIGMATIYRVLGQLEQAGLVQRSAFGEDRAVYELNEGSHHDHLVCINCGRVDEFTDNTIEARQQAVANQHGYVLTDHRLALYGLCPKCGTAKAKGR
jgi:Fur family ferric uptake transcriptional regulator